MQQSDRATFESGPVAFVGFRLSVLGQRWPRHGWGQAGKSRRFGSFAIAECVKHFEHFAPGGEGAAVRPLVLIHRLHEDDFFLAIIALTSGRIDLATSLALVSSI